MGDNVFAALQLSGPQRADKSAAEIDWRIFGNLKSLAITDEPVGILHKGLAERLSIFLAGLPSSGRAASAGTVET